MARDPRFLILAEGAFNPVRCKTGNACLRYVPERVAAVLDSTQRGKTAAQVLGFGGDIPVVGSIDEGLARKPNALLIGIAPQGGQLPTAWRPGTLPPLDDRLNVSSGPHQLLEDDNECAAAPRRSA